MARNKEGTEEKVLLLSKLLYMMSDHISYVSRKYVFVPLKVNRDYKKYSSKQIMTIRANPLVFNKSNSVDKDKIESVAYYSSAIFNFINVLEKKFTKSVLRNFYHNINSISVNEVKEMIKNPRTKGRYNLFNNIIYLKEKQVVSIYHELFHMSSTKVFGNFSYSGFSLYNRTERKSIGIGITEGYTQLMTERYFGNDSTTRFLEKNYGIENAKRIVGRSYQFQVLIASKLEEIIGKEKMEELYLNADLYGLVDELTKYSSKEEINDFISKMDFLHSNIKSVYEFSLKNDKLKRSFVEVSNFLLKCYSKKIDIEHGDVFLYKRDVINYYLNDLINFYDRYFSFSNDNSNRRR